MSARSNSHPLQLGTDAVEAYGEIGRCRGVPYAAPSDARIVVLGRRVRVLAADELEGVDLLQGQVVAQEEVVSLAYALV